MLPDETRILLDDVVSLPLSQREENLRARVQRVAETLVASGMAGATFPRIKVYYDHFESVGEQLWSHVKRVLDETMFEGYPGCENDVFEYWKKSVAPVREECKTSIYGLQLARNQMPKPSFDEHCQQVEQKVFAEIKIFSARVRAMKQEKEKYKVPASNTYVLHGANSRVNIDSVDNSLNIVEQSELFSRLRDAVKNQVEDAPLQAQLSALIDRMEQSPKTSIFNSAYARFMELAAHHVHVVSPFIPALSQLLAGITT